MLLQMTLHVSSCCHFLSWHICREFSSANFFFSFSSQENSLIKVTHGQNILFILFIQCFAEREAQIWYKRFNCWRNKERAPGITGATPNQHRVRVSCSGQQCYSHLPEQPAPSHPCLPLDPISLQDHCRDHSSTSIWIWVGREKNQFCLHAVVNKPVWKCSAGQRSNLWTHRATKKNCTLLTLLDFWICHSVAHNSPNGAEEGKVRSYLPGFNF